MFRKLLTLLMVFTLLGFCTTTANAGPRNNKDRVLTVMTRNMDAGSDFWYVLTADPTNLLSILGGISATFQEIHGSNIPARADGIAAEIQATLPDLVGLQEVTTLSAGPDATHMAVVDDMLASLRAALAQRGLHYDAIVIQKNADITLPAFDQAFNLISVGLTDFDVVLARTDLPVSEFKLENIQRAYFPLAHILQLEVAGVPIPFTRGWIAVDAKLRGKQYRFVTTHLETFSDIIQALQTEDLLTGPLASDLPVILAGDLNSDADAPNSSRGPAFGILTSAGFLDIWSNLHPNDPGFTWPLHPEDVPAAPPAVPQRIDLVLTHGDGTTARSEILTGTAPVSGLWSSDHAGVVASFAVLPQQ
ncbi:MAG TPA: endonuclease/exonuclease/phosphatase family protein [Terriglobales bacterium]|nr:endonuclease/exonuclease/phosphatase family protein [Terriglobales bacterium]